MPSWKTACARAPAELEQSNARLLESEQRRSLAIAAGKMGSWDWDWVNGDWMWDEGQYRIFGVDPQSFAVTPANIQALLHPDDIERTAQGDRPVQQGRKSYEAEFRINRPDGEIRWCVGTAAATTDKSGRVVRVSGVTVDITERKRAEERQNLLDPGGRPPRQECAGAGAIDRSADARRRRQGLHRRPSKAGSVRWRGCIPSSRCRAGRARRSAGSSTRNSRPIRPATRSPSAARGPVAARDRANAGAGAARAGHQFGQVWRPVHACRAACRSIGRSRADMLQMAWEENGRAACREAGVAGIWHTEA